MKDKKIQGKNKKKRNLKEQGITLIALVVTIILLLILAGVTISQIAGSNGLFQRARQAVEKYKNAAEEEQIQIGMLEQYVTDFSVVGGDEGENKASITIETFTVEGNPKEQTITVNLTIEGQASKIEYSIDNGKEWITEEKGKTEYEHTFEELALGKSYIVRVKVYDTDGKYVEAISDIVTLSNSITAEEKDVLRDKTYLAEDGSIKTGTMPNNGAVNKTLNAGESYEIPEGYHDGKGTVTVSELSNQTPGDAKAEEILSGKKAWVDGTLITGKMANNGEINETLSAGGEKVIPAGYTSGGTITVKTLREQTPGDATAAQILNTKKAWVNGGQVTGNMPDKSNSTVTANSVTTDGDYTLITIPEAGYYSTKSKIKTLSSNIDASSFIAGAGFFIGLGPITAEYDGIVFSNCSRGEKNDTGPCWCRILINGVIKASINSNQRISTNFKKGDTIQAESSSSGYTYNTYVYLK